MAGECVERFVEQQKTRIDGKRTCEVHSLTHTARDIPQGIVGILAQTCQRQQRVDLVAQCVARQAMQLQPEADVLRDVLPRQQGIILRDDAAFRARPRHGHAVQRDLASHRRDEPRDYVEQRRLAATRRTEHHCEAAVAQIEIDVRQHGTAPCARFEVDTDGFDVDHRLACRVGLLLDRLLHIGGSDRRTIIGQQRVEALLLLEEFRRICQRGGRATAQQRAARMLVEQRMVVPCSIGGTSAGSVTSTSSFASRKSCRRGMNRPIPNSGIRLTVICLRVERSRTKQAKRHCQHGDRRILSNCNVFREWENRPS